MTLQREWAEARMPLVTVPHAASPELAEEVRARLTEWTRYTQIDRASYDFIERPAAPALLDILLTLAEDITGRTLHLDTWRALRLLPGDYVLVRHDRVYEDSPVELTLDLSPAAVPGAEIHYRHRGQVFATVPSRPGDLVLVERGPTVMCNHTYVSKLHRGAVVVRLVALLTSAPGSAPTP